MAAYLKTPFDLAHAYGFALQSMIDLATEQEITPDRSEGIDITDMIMLRRRLEGESMTSIAKAFGVSPSRVRQRILRGCTRLRTLRYHRRCRAVARDAVVSLSGGHFEQRMEVNTNEAG